LLGLQGSANDQKQHILRRLFGQLLQHGSALGARRAVGHPELNDAQAGKQRQAAAGLADARPIEAAVDVEHLALAIAALARGGTDLVQRFLDQQRLVAGNDVDRRQRSGQMGGDLRGIELHARIVPDRPTPGTRPAAPDDKRKNTAGHRPGRTQDERPCDKGLGTSGPG